MTKVIKKELPSQESSTSIIPQERQAVNFNAQTLISQAIDKNVPVETMEKLLAMRRELKAEWAKEQYDKAMAGFQADCPIIQKTKEVKDGSKLLYKYAPIESIIQQVKLFLQKHGFSYLTGMEVLPDGIKVICKVTHIAGHSEESSMQIPLGTKTGIMSASQQTAAAQTFAKRYAFCNAFGILTGDEDNDGAEIKQSPSSQTIAAPVLSDIAKIFIQDLIECKDIETFDTITKDMNSANYNKKLTVFDWQEIKKQHMETMNQLKTSKSNAAELMEQGIEKSKQVTQAK